MTIEHANPAGIEHEIWKLGDRMLDLWVELAQTAATAEHLAAQANRQTLEV